MDHLCNSYQGNSSHQGNAGAVNILPPDELLYTNSSGVASNYGKICAISELSNSTEGTTVVAKVTTPLQDWCVSSVLGFTWGSLFLTLVSCA